MNKGIGIPRSPFWDINPTHLDLRQNKKYIIERILEFGDDKAVEWLFSTYSRNDIKNVLHESRRISRKSSHYWALLLK